MDTASASPSLSNSLLGQNSSYLLIALLVIVVFAGLGYFFLVRRANTMPNLSPFQDMLPIEEGDKKMKGASELVVRQVNEIQGETVQEGFYGGVARGAGIPDCLRTSSEAAQLHAMFVGRCSSTEEGAGDLREFTLLLSQLACFKKDLLGIAQQVEATRYQPFATQIDMEPIAETTARCFAKTIPPRDLDLFFDKWFKRGHFLITRLCTSANFTETEFKVAEQTYRRLIKTLYDIAKDKCLTGTPILDGKISPRDPHPYTNPEEANGRKYAGYY